MQTPSLLPLHVLISKKFAMVCNSFYMQSLLNFFYRLLKYIKRNFPLQLIIVYHQILGILRYWDTEHSKPTYTFSILKAKIFIFSIFLPPHAYSICVSNLDPDRIRIKLLTWIRIRKQAVSKTEKNELIFYVLRDFWKSVCLSLSLNVLFRDLRGNTKLVFSGSRLNPD